MLKRRSLPFTSFHSSSCCALSIELMPDRCPTIGKLCVFGINIELYGELHQTKFCRSIIDKHFIRLWNRLFIPTTILSVLYTKWKEMREKNSREKKHIFESECISINQLRWMFYLFYAVTVLSPGKTNGSPSYLGSMFLYCMKTLCTTARLLYINSDELLEYKHSLVGLALPISLILRSAVPNVICLQAATL